LLVVIASCSDDVVLLISDVQKKNKKGLNISMLAKNRKNG
jgi:hypothetical protein